MLVHPVSLPERRSLAQKTMLVHPVSLPERRLLLLTLTRFACTRFGVVNLATYRGTKVAMKQVSI